MARKTMPEPEVTRSDLFSPTPPTKLARARKTMAEAEAERYTLAERLAERKRILVRQLQLRFPPLPAEIEQTVQSTQDADQLARWLDSFATAADLDSIGILPSR
jgi:hypothetical protein